MGVYKGQINNIEIGLDVVVNDYAYNYGTNNRLLELSQRFDSRDEALSLLLTEYIPQLIGVMRRFGVTSKRFYALTNNVSGRNASSPFGLTNPVTLEASSPVGVIGPKGNTIQQISTTWTDSSSAGTTGSGLYSFYSFFNGACQYSGTGQQVESGTIFILPTNVFIDGVIPADFSGPIEWCSFNFEAALDHPSIYEPNVWVARVNASILHGSTDYTTQFLDWFGGVQIIPEDDPMAQGGDSDNEPGTSPFSGVGGTGTFSRASDSIGVPADPSISAVDSGLVSLHVGAAGDMQNLANYLWSGLFDVDTFKKLFSSPMDVIIGASMLPVTPTNNPAAHIIFGNVDTGVVMPRATSQYFNIDCGTKKIEEYWGAYLDYSPYTKMHIYLPYIGFRELNADEVMGHTVGVKYKIDCLSGACTAFITIDGSVFYTYSGSCAIQVPLTANNWGSAISSIIQVAGQAVGGFATGGVQGALVQGGSALAQNAIAGGFKPDIQRQGSVTGSGGWLAVQKPYIILEWPRQSKPQGLNLFEGYPANETMLLSTCKGYTRVEEINLEGIPCTGAELDEIETLLKSGVYF